MVPAVEEIEPDIDQPKYLTDNALDYPANCHKGND